ncbi:hypothetical protein [Dethiobacter alkaliphilus]|uniref:hypothetical protein n=1 Tax=Dethiobacter alkaliphilus TaxID=427926 RepID=UPI002227C9F4|nr:hypothetical protein [Dethiobacter alkaliphilus]MCW3489426.1 hypothetical protein [Dethiobacter alkaliphilus]
MRKNIFISLMIISLLIVQAEPALAWPAFAERVDQPCATCHEPGFTGLAPFGQAFLEEDYRWPGEEGEVGGPPRRITIFGQTMLMWTGILAALFIGSALAAVFLGRKYKRIVRGRWHHRLGLTGSGFALIHAVLAILQSYFGIAV